MYIDSMGRTLYNLFRNYNIQLTKLELVIATKQNLVAIEETAMRSMFTQKVFCSISKFIRSLQILLNNCYYYFMQYFSIVSPSKDGFNETNRCVFVGRS